MRFFRYSGGVYTSIGSITSSPFILPTLRTVITFPATAFPSMALGSSDLLYTDLWLYDNTGAGGDLPSAYMSSSSAAGVSNDMQITTPGYA